MNLHVHKNHYFMHESSVRHLLQLILNVPQKCYVGINFFSEGSNISECKYL